MQTATHFLLLEGSELSERAFVIHLNFPRFVIEFGIDGPGPLVLGEAAEGVELPPLRDAAILFYQRQLESFETYQVVHPQN